MRCGAKNGAAPLFCAVLLLEPKSALGRIYKFLKTCGYPIGDTPYFSDGATMAFRYYFDEYFGAKVDAMPAYPYDGYISEVRDDELGLHYYIVKLGNNWRKPELLPPE